MLDLWQIVDGSIHYCVSTEVQRCTYRKIDAHCMLRGCCVRLVGRVLVVVNYPPARMLLGTHAARAWHWCRTAVPCFAHVLLLIARCIFTRLDLDHHHIQERCDPQRYRTTVSLTVHPY